MVGAPDSSTGRGGRWRGASWKTHWDHSSRQRVREETVPRCPCSCLRQRSLLGRPGVKCGCRLCSGQLRGCGLCAGGIITWPLRSGHGWDRSRHVAQHANSPVRPLPPQEKCKDPDRPASPRLALRGVCSSPHPTPTAPPPSVGLDSAPAGSIRCLVDARKVGMRKKQNTGQMPGCVHEVEPRHSLVSSRFRFLPSFLPLAFPIGCGLQRSDRDSLRVRAFGAWGRVGPWQSPSCPPWGEGVGWKRQLARAASAGRALVTSISSEL